MARLDKAGLSGARLEETNFASARLSRARLPGADLSGAILLRESLDHADLSRACLAGSFLAEIAFYAAHLRGTNLKNTDLRDAAGRTQLQLNAACGDDSTRASDWLSVRLCN